MRCDKMHATIAIRQCLANQEKLAGNLWLNQRGSYYPGCKGCETGTLARRGKLNDDDLRALLDGYHRRAHPPADVVTETVRGEASGLRSKPRYPAPRRPEPAAEQRVMETAINQDREGKMETTQPEAGNVQVADETKRKCKKCNKLQPIGRFSREKKGEEKRKHVCNDCAAAYQRDRKEKIRAAAAEEQRMRHDVKLIEDHAEAARQSMEKQAEPTPAKETTAPACLTDRLGSPSHDELPDDEHVLSMDFSCYPEVLKEIKRIAHHEERPPEVQARFMLKRLLQGEQLQDLPDRDRLGFQNRVGLPSGYQPMFIGVDMANGPDEVAVTPDASPLTPHRSEAACA